MKVLIIGLGSIAKKHIQALRKIGEVSIYALRSSSKSLNFAGVTNLYSDEELENTNFDFFIIANPTSKHAEAIERVLKYKKPLFIEKPLFNKIGKAHQILVNKITREKIPNYVACNLRFLHCLTKAKKMIKGARINEINCYCGSYLPDWRPGINFRENYSAHKEMGGGVHIDLIHELDYLCWFFGLPQKSKARFSSKSHLNINAVDYANYLLQYKECYASVILNYYRRDAKRTLEIVTSKNTLEVNLLQNKIYIDGKEVYTSPQTILDTYEEQMRFFLKYSVKNNTHSTFNTVNNAYKILALCTED